MKFKAGDIVKTFDSEDGDVTIVIVGKGSERGTYAYHFPETPENVITVGDAVEINTYFRKLTKLERALR